MADEKLWIREISDLILICSMFWFCLNRHCNDVPHPELHLQVCHVTVFDHAGYSMLRFRRFQSTFFSKPPLNYESLALRVAELRSSGNLTRDLIVDYARANRRLQKIKKHSRRQLKSELTGKKNFLDFKVNVSSAQLEDELWEFLRHSWDLCVNDESVVAAFLLNPDADVGRCFQIVKSNFGGSMNSTSHTVPAALLLRKLLKKSDYHNCIGLLDSTFNSAAYLQVQKTRLRKRLGECGLIVGALSALQCSFISLSLLYYLLPLTTISVFATVYGLSKAYFPSVGERVSWRPHTSVVHRFIHRHEQAWMNTIITHFEEHSELNFKNYHTSEVRRPPTLGMSRQDEYDMFLPSTTNLPALAHEARSEHTESVAQYFREELQKRRLNWNTLKEERTLLEFWLSHGENYEWVEPDQDPGEMCTFRSHSSNPYARDR